MDNVNDVNKEITKTKVSTEESRKLKKKEYKKPQLKNYGKLKDIVLGGTLGTEDSGNPLNERMN